MRKILKSWLEPTGYRLVNSARRWGVDVFDDLKRLTVGADPLQVIFDVGANRGQTSLALLRTFQEARVYAFEPVQGTYASLCTNVRHEPRITPECIALSDEACTADISLFGDDGKSSLNGTMEDSLHRCRSGTQSVSITTVDQYCNERRIDQIDLLKSDTEGHDRKVLIGARRMLREGRVRFVYVEFHHLSQFDRHEEQGLNSLTELADLLRPCGFRFVSVYTDSVHHDEPVGTHNALFAYRPDLVKRQHEPC